MLVAGINMHILDDIRRLLSTATTQYVPVQEEKVKSTVINLSTNLVYSFMCTVDRERKSTKKKNCN